MLRAISSKPEILVESLRRAGFSVVRVHPAVSEHPTRLATRGGTRGFSRALIIAAKKRSRCRQLSITKLESKMEGVVKGRYRTFIELRY